MPARRSVQEPRPASAGSPDGAPGTASLPWVWEHPCVLLKHGEVFLRGRNRALFEERLLANLRTALDRLDGRTWIRKGRSVTFVGGEVPGDVLLAAVRRVVGFGVVQPALRIAGGQEEIEAAAAEVLGVLRAERGRFSFAVRAKRRDRAFPLTSTRLAAAVGARVQGESDLPVDLSSPDVELRVEVERGESYLSWRRLRGLEGLPVGTSGRALALLSGGYDSPVAAHRAMRRGLRCDFVHFTGAPYTDPSSAYKAYALARELNAYQPAARLHVVPMGRAQKQLAIAGAGRVQVVAQRRLMVRAASALARDLGADALVTGDSLGQVASQTVANLAAVDEAATLPVLRPLLGWEKQEIINEATAIGTAQISVLPDEDCCGLLAPPRVTTKAHAGELQRVERRLELDEVVEELLAGAQCLRPGAPGAPVGTSAVEGARPGQSSAVASTPPATAS